MNIRFGRRISAFVLKSILTRIEISGLIYLNHNYRFRAGVPRIHGGTRAELTNHCPPSGVTAGTCAAPTAPDPSVLGRRLFHMVDHHHVDRGLFGLKLEA